MIRAENDFEIAPICGKLNMEKIVDINKYLKSAENVSIGVDPKFWVNIDGNKYLYKYYEEEKFSDTCRRGQMRSINEVLVGILCKKLGIECVESSLAVPRLITALISEAKNQVLRKWIPKDA